MNKSQAFYSRRLSSVLLLNSSLMLFPASQGRAQSPTQDAQTTTTTSAPTPQTDAEKKAAERKKRFEESKKVLESKDQPAPQPKTQNAPTNPNSTAKPISQPSAKIVFTIPVTMAIGESQRFYLYDEQLGDVTGIAEWTAKDESSAADFSIVGGVPVVVSKGSGDVTISAVFRDRSAVVALSIIPKDKMTGDTVRWTQASTQTHSSLHIVPAVPNFVPRR
jgi:hypothetical protein